MCGRSVVCSAPVGGVSSRGGAVRSRPPSGSSSRRRGVSPGHRREEGRSRNACHLPGESARESSAVAARSAWSRGVATDSRRVRREGGHHVERHADGRRGRGWGLNDRTGCSGSGLGSDSFNRIDHRIITGREATFTRHQDRVIGRFVRRKGCVRNGKHSGCGNGRRRLQGELPDANAGAAVDDLHPLVAAMIGDASSDRSVRHTTPQPGDSPPHRRPRCWSGRQPSRSPSNCRRHECRGVRMAGGTRPGRR